MARLKKLGMDPLMGLALLSVAIWAIAINPILAFSHLRAARSLMATDKLKIMVPAKWFPAIRIIISAAIAVSLICSSVPSQMVLVKVYGTVQALDLAL